MSSEERITITKRNSSLTFDKSKIILLRDTLFQFERLSSELHIVINDNKIKFYVVTLGSTAAAELIFDFNSFEEFPDINIKDWVHCDKLVKFLGKTDSEFFDNLEMKFIDGENEYLELNLKTKNFNKKLTLKRYKSDRRTMRITLRDFERTIEIDQSIFNKMIDPIFEHILISVQSRTFSTEEYNSKNQDYPVYTTKKFKSEKDRKLYRAVYNPIMLAYGIIKNHVQLEFSLDHKGPARIIYFGKDYTIAFAYAPRIKTEDL